MLLIIASTLSFPAFAMNPTNFSEFMDSLEEAPFYEEQELLVSSAAENHRFSCEQVEQILQEITFSSDKLRMLRVLIPRTKNIAHSYRLLNEFDFVSDKIKAQKIISDEQSRRSKESLQKRRPQQQNQKNANQNRHRQRTEYWIEPQGNVRPERNETSLRWVGTCPYGVYSDGTPVRECVQLQNDRFNPFSGSGHHLWLETKGTGVVTITVELGPVVSNCQTHTSVCSSEIATWKIPVTQRHQVIDVESMIDNWNRRNVRINAEFHEHSTGIVLNDWITRTKTTSF